MSCSMRVTGSLDQIFTKQPVLDRPSTAAAAKRSNRRMTETPTSQGRVLKGSAPFPINPVPAPTKHERPETVQDLTVVSAIPVAHLRELVGFVWFFRAAPASG